MAIWYFVQSLVFLVVSFFKHWYVDGFFYVVRAIAAMLRALEKKWALKNNAYFMFEPLYQEKNIYGYIFGFVYRSLKVFFGGMVYVVIVTCGLSLYIVWALIPLYSMYRLIYG
jgi:hypothetical protein